MLQYNQKGFLYQDDMSKNVKKMLLKSEESVLEFVDEIRFGF